jgi:UDP-glucose 4-epimerase
VSSWLVTGGAGYIGAHVVRALRERDESVVVIDDLSTGDAGRVGDADLVTGSILDTDLVRSTIKKYDVAGIVHIAAKKQVGESVAQPLMYYRENVGGLISVLSAATDAGVEQLVFSSSAATYGMPDVEVVTEQTPGVPLSPYGETKVIGEWLTRAVSAASTLRVVSLRYFNVAGAATPELGDPAILNLVPMALERMTAGEPPRIFGDDYPTPDGTCIRDYVHVADIADAHAAAMRYLSAGGQSATYNIGRGVGSSVREVLTELATATGIDLPPVVVARRPGDPARCVASVAKIEAELGWSARYDLADMVSSAWAAWQQKK